jgi:hypothetical protein
MQTGNSRPKKKRKVAIGGMIAEDSGALNTSKDHEIVVLDSESASPGATYLTSNGQNSHSLRVGSKNIIPDPFAAMVDSSLVTNDSIHASSCNPNDSHPGEVILLPPSGSNRSLAVNNSQSTLSSKSTDTSTPWQGHHKSFYMERIEYYDTKCQALKLKRDSKMQGMGVMEIYIEKSREEIRKIQKRYEQLFKELEVQRDKEICPVKQKEQNYQLSVQVEKEAVKKIESRISNNEKLRKLHQDVLCNLDEDDGSE